MKTRYADCVECGETFEAAPRGRLAERCPVHRSERKLKMTAASHLRRRPCKHPDGCPNTSHHNGWCGMHAYRISRDGDPGPVGRKEPQKRYQYGTGYVLVRVGRGRGRKALRYEHHVVMEGIIGRELLPDETVHHRNGVRNDNRPGNLELWTKAQPAGQRVTDKVAWAVELLERYAPELLAEKPVQLRLA